MKQESKYATPKIPEREQERLQALYELDLLDTEAERNFDELVELAALICDAPIALCTLIDADRQWFKARTGLDLAQTSRDVSFCGHAINGTEPFIINDTHNDDRFRHNPLVVGGVKIRYYAGFPLVLEDGLALGTLCVIDDKPRRLSQRQIDAVMSLKRQVEDQLRLRHALRRIERDRERISKQRADIDAATVLLDRLTARIPDVFWVMARDGSQGVYVSPSFETLWEMPRERFAKNPTCWISRVHPDDRPLMMKALVDGRAGEDLSFSYRIIDAAGDVRRWVRTTAFLVENETGVDYVAGLTADFTEHLHENARLASRVDHIKARFEHADQQLSDTRRQLWQLQKMESMGRLAGGISHDFNNMLSVISSCASFLIQDLDEDDPRRQDALDIHEAAEQSASLTRQLLAFSRKQVLESKLTNLDQVLLRTSKLFRRVLDASIELSVEAAAGNLEIMVDPSQLEQVLVNLVVNARDALDGRGRITVETRTAAVSSGQHPTVPAGVYGVVSVRDAGVGMDAATCERIFEPFFTTKAEGKGTGLGLASVHGFVTQSGGYICVDSAPGEGSEFTIWLPEATDEQRASALEAQMPPQTTSPASTAKILLVEDNPLVRRSMVRALERHGFELLVAANAIDAATLWREHRGDVSALVADMLTPSKSGLQLLEELRADCPTLPALLISGYRDDRHDELAGVEAATVLRKPLDPQHLVSSLTLLLQARREYQAPSAD